MRVAEVVVAVVVLIVVVLRPADMEEPTAVAKKEDLNPILWTWFIIAIMVAVTMICVIFFSMWVYSQR